MDKKTALAIAAACLITVAAWGQQTQAHHRPLPSSYNSFARGLIANLWDNMDKVLSELYQNRLFSLYQNYHAGNQVPSLGLRDGAVTATKLADGAITDDKVIDTITASLYLPLTGGTINGLTNFTAGGTGLNVTNQAALGSLTIGGGDTITKHLSATATIDFPELDDLGGALGNVRCNAQNLTVTGAASGDSVVATPAATTGGIETLIATWRSYVSAPNTVSVSACGIVPDQDPASQTWRIDIWKH